VPVYIAVKSHIPDRQNKYRSAYEIKIPTVGCVGKSQNPWRNKDPGTYNKGDPFFPDPLIAYCPKGKNNKNNSHQEGIP